MLLKTSQKIKKKEKYSSFQQVNNCLAKSVIKLRWTFIPYNFSSAVLAKALFDDAHNEKDKDLILFIFLNTSVINALTII